MQTSLLTIYWVTHLPFSVEWSVPASLFHFTCHQVAFDSLINRNFFFRWFAEIKVPSLHFASRSFHYNLFLHSERWFWMGVHTRSIWGSSLVIPCPPCSNRQLPAQCCFSYNHTALKLNLYIWTSLFTEMVNLRSGSIDQCGDWIPCDTIYVHFYL